MDDLLYWANLFMLILLPISLILALIISLVCFIFAKLINKMRPGTISDEKMKMLKIVLIIFVISAVVLFAIDAGILLIFYGGIPNM